MVALGVAGLLATAAPAGAQPFAGNFFVGGAATTIYGMTVRGVVIVSFHGDPGTGCAAHGLCGFSGVLTVRPGTQGDLTVARPGRKRGPDAVSVIVGSGVSPGSVVADVDRSSGGRVLGHCSDVQQLGGFGVVRTSHHGVIAVSPLDVAGGSLSTRCAGPSDGDLARAASAVTARVNRLHRPGDRIDLSGTRTFAAAGFAGTVRSSIVLVVGRKAGSSSGGAFPPGVKTERYREVSEALDVVSASGQLSAAIRGTGDSSECQLLDSCLLTGTLTAPLAPPHAQASLVATGPAKRPYRDFLKALELGSRGNARGIDVGGAIHWSGGSFLETIDQGGRCSDTARDDDSLVVLQVGKRGLAGMFGTTGAMRTRCPGPFFSAENQTLAKGRVGLGVFRRRTFTLRLGGSGAFADEGYSVVSHSRLSFVLRHGRVSQSSFTQPG